MLNASSPPPGRSKCIHFCWSNIFYAANRNQGRNKTSHVTGSLYETKNITNFNSFKKTGRFDSKCLRVPAYGLVTGHLSIRLNAMFQAEELPAGIANLDSALSSSALFFYGCYRDFIHVRLHQSGKPYHLCVSMIWLINWVFTCKQLHD